MKPELKKLIIDIRVHDLNRAVAFYRDVLGSRLICKEADWASFEAAGAEIHLYLHGGTESGLEFRVANLENAVEELKANSAKFFIDTNQINSLKIAGDIIEFPWGRAAFFKDSEGNQIALVEDGA